mmetsp:Transcript_32965/g.60343  ORF Transcript_32965/g.60343 Transcript_32965/m.60343 type:complete len:231 (+) Transcript_32965:45-737(+)
MPRRAWLALLLYLAWQVPQQPAFTTLRSDGLDGASRAPRLPKASRASTRLLLRAEVGTTTRSPATGLGNSSEVVLEEWRVQPDGRFRGSLPDGLIVEIQGELIGPSDPGVLLGNNGVRYVLGQPAGEAPADAASSLEPESMDLRDKVLMGLAGLGAALGLAGAVANTNVLQPPGPVTKTNVTIIETWKTNAEGKTVKVIEKKVTKERSKPGSAPVVTETSSYTEKELRKR